jgi:hypothetical protein
VLRARLSCSGSPPEYDAGGRYELKVWSFPLDNTSSVVLTGAPANANVPVQAWVFLN